MTNFDWVLLVVTLHLQKHCYKAAALVQAMVVARPPIVDVRSCSLPYRAIHLREKKKIKNKISEQKQYSLSTLMDRVFFIAPLHDIRRLSWRGRAVVDFILTVFR